MIDKNKITKISKIVLLLEYKTKELLFLKIYLKTWKKKRKGKR